MSKKQELQRLAALEQEMLCEFDFLQDFVELLEGSSHDHVVMSLRWHRVPGEFQPEGLINVPLYGRHGPDQPHPLNPFCLIMNGNMQHKEACRESDLGGVAEVMRTRSTLVYECHAGLTDIAAPIVSGDTYLGTLFSGQVLLQPPTEEKFERIRKSHAHLTYIDFDRLREAYVATPVISDQELDRMIHRMELVARFLVTSWERVNRLIMLQRQMLRARTWQTKEFVERAIRGLLGDRHEAQRELKLLGVDRWPRSVFVVRAVPEGRNEPDTPGDRLIRHALHEVETQLESCPGSLVSQTGPEELVVLAALPEARSAAARAANEREFAEQILGMLPRENGCPWMIGIGDRAAGPRTFAEAYRSAVEAIRMHGGLKMAPIVRANDIRSRNIPEHDVLHKLTSQAVRLMSDGTPEFGAKTDELLASLQSFLSAQPVARRPFAVDIMESFAQSALKAGCPANRVDDIRMRFLLDIGSLPDAVQLVDRLHDCLRSLFAEVQRSCSGRREKIIRQAKEFIAGNLSESLRREIVADVVGLSPNYFSALFHAETGVTFREHLRRTRIDAARRLLLNPNLSVTEVAVEVGFNNLSHFCRTFSRYVGVPPRRYQMAPTGEVTERER